MRFYCESFLKAMNKSMVLTLVDNERGVAYPLDFAMCFNVGTPGYIKGHDLCIKLVLGVISEGFPPLFTTVDSCPLEHELSRNM